jgi:biopolymer transport protein ExbD
MSTTTIDHKPHINVTPLIDVLLVLLIIFMVAAPLKPYRFAAKLPAPPDNRNLPPGDLTLVVTIESDRSLKLNRLDEMGTVDEPLKLIQTLTNLFQERLRNHAYREDMMTRIDVPERLRIQKTVFVKAPRSIPYGEVTRIVDILKGAGADPIGLQLDGLN